MEEEGTSCEMIFGWEWHGCCLMNETHPPKSGKYPWTDLCLSQSLTVCSERCFLCSLFRMLLLTSCIQFRTVVVCLARCYIILLHLGRHCTLVCASVCFSVLVSSDRGLLDGPYQDCISYEQTSSHPLIQNLVTRYLFSK